MGSFVNYAGQIYYNFDRKQNVLDIYSPKTNEIHIGMDFNIDPMSAVISELKGNNIYVYDEIVIYSSNTDEMVQEIKNRFKDKHIFIYPDPASKQRKTSAKRCHRFSNTQERRFSFTSKKQSSID